MILQRARKFLPAVNVLASNLNTGLAMVGAFVITPAVLLGLGDSAYGGWLLMNSMIGYMRMLDQGTSLGTMRLGAAAIARDDAGDIAKVFDTSAALFAGAGVLGIAVSLALAVALPRYYSGIIGDNGLAVLILGIATSVDLLFRVFPASLRTRSLFVVVDGVEIVTYSIFKLGLVLYFSHSLSYLTLAWILLAESVVRNALIVLASRHYCPFVRHLQPQRADAVVLREFISMGAAFSILTLADLVRYQLDAGVIGYFIPSDSLAISIFGVGQRLPSTAFAAIGVIGAVLIPRFSSLSERGDDGAVTSLLRKASLVTGLASGFVLVNCAVLGPQFLLIWLKKPWVVESGRILIVLVPAYFMALQCGPSAGLLVAKGRLRGQIVITVIEAVANFALSVALIGRFGVMGVAIGTVIPMIVVRGLLFPIVMRVELGMPLRTYYAMHIRPVVISCIYALTVGWLYWVPFTTYGGFVAMAVLTTAVFSVITLVGVPEARTLIRQQLMSR